MLQYLYHGFSGLKFELFQTAFVLFLKCTVLCFVCFLSALLLTVLVSLAWLLVMSTKSCDISEEDLLSHT